MSTVVKTERLKHIAALAERCGQNQIVGFAASEVSAIAAELLELRRAPVVPDALPENDDEDGHDIDYLEPSEVYGLGRTAGWNACRAAMLNQAPVKQPSSNPKSELLQRAEKLAENTKALAERVGGGTCEWKPDSDHSWEGQCGTKWQFFDDGPTENGMKFCPGCGKPVLSSPPDE